MQKTAIVPMSVSENRFSVYLIVEYALNTLYFLAFYAFSDTLLGVPDYATLIGFYKLLGLFNSEVLVHTRQLFDAAIEQDEIVH